MSEVCAHVKWPFLIKWPKIVPQKTVMHFPHTTPYITCPTKSSLQRNTKNIMGCLVTYLSDVWNSLITIKTMS